MKIKKDRNIAWLFLGFVALSALGFITRTLLPQSTLLVFIFIGILASGLFSFAYFASVNARVSLLVSGGAAVWLLLRYIGLREPMFIVLLLASLFSIELYFRKK